MSNMGTKSNKLFTSALNPGSYLPCPPGKSEAFRQLWDETVRDYPPDYFRVSHKPLIRQYVQAELQLRDVSDRMDNDPEGYVVETPQGTKPNPLISIQSSLATQVMSCAKVLRVAPISQSQSTQVPKTPEQAPVAAPTEGKRRLKIAGVVDS
jgi:hypothetical protein